MIDRKRILFHEIHKREAELNFIVQNSKVLKAKWKKSRALSEALIRNVCK